MFNQTEAHKEEISPEQKRIRIGKEVPEGAVSLAYVHSERLKPKENVLITDIGRTIPENIAGTREGVIELWPNDQGLLRTWEGQTSVGARSLLLTNRFEQGIPLYYVYVSDYPIHRTATSTITDLENNITLVGGDGHKLPEDVVYRITFSPSSSGEYFIHIFTNFQAQPVDDIKLFYTARKNGKNVPGHSEVFHPQEAFRQSRSLQDVTLGEATYAYYKSDSERIGESKLYVEGIPLKDSDYRRPIGFRYRLTGRATPTEGEPVEIQTPWIYDSVFGEGQLSKVDTYYRNGWKDLDDGKTAQEILSTFGDITLFERSDSHVLLSVESSKDEVEVYVQQEGRTPVRARTKTKTGILPEPDSYKTEFRVKRHTSDIWIQVDEDEPELIRTEVSVLDGHKKIAGPFEGHSIAVQVLREEEPVTVYVADDSVYVYTKQLEVYHVPKYVAFVQNDNRLRVNLPSTESDRDNWYLRVKNGQFRRRMLDEKEVSFDQFYGLPEYYSQDFDAEYGMPYRRILNETPEVIGNNRIRVLHTPLRVYEAEDILNLEITVNDTPVEVIGWDENEGTIELGVNIKDIDRIGASYIHEETSYTYRGYLDEETGRYWHLDLNPGPGHAYTEEDEHTGEIQDQPSFRLINRTVYLYIKANARFDTRNVMIPGSYRAKTLYHTFKEESSDDAILLARINVRPNSNKGNVKIIDTRVLGGGIQEDIQLDRMKRIEKESDSYWDIGSWDGEPISLNGVTVVHLPRNILEGHGGSLTKSRVEESVRKHMAYGVMPIIEYIDEAKRLLDRPLSLNATIEEEAE